MPGLIKGPGLSLTSGLAYYNSVGFWSGSPGLFDPSAMDRLGLYFDTGRYWMAGIEYASVTAIPGWTFTRPGYNAIPNSTPTVGSVPGTPGTPPTGWFFGSTAGLSSSVVGTGTEFGFPYIDFRLVGTATGTSIPLVFNSASAIAASAGQTWTGSHYIRQVGGSAANVTNTYCQAAGIGGSAGLTNGAAQAPTSTFTRQTATHTLGSGATNFWNQCIITVVNGAAVDITFRIYAPQAEPGSAVGGYQITTGTAVTSGANTTYAPGLIDDVVTNKLTCWSANPTEAAGFVGNPVNMSKSGDAAAILSVENDVAALAAAGLSNVCTSGKVYKLDNSAGVAAATVSIQPPTGNTNQHTFSGWVRGGSGQIGSNSVARLAFGASASYVRRVQAGVTPSGASDVIAFRADPGAILYIILPQLIERSAAISQDIVTQGASASAVVGKVDGLIAFGPNVPRITDAGFTVEGVATETCGNSGFSGVSTGALTSGTSFGAGSFLTPEIAAGVTASIVATGTANGSPYIDIQVQGTPAASPHFQIQYQSNATSPAALTGEQWAVSIYAQLVGGSFTGVSAASLRCLELTAANAVVATQQSAVTIDGVWGRKETVLALAGGATTAKVRGLLAFSGSGVAVNYTVRLQLPNLQKASQVTSPIPTFGTAVTRAADNPYITGLGAILTAPFTMAVEAYLPAGDGATRVIAMAGDGTVNNRVAMERNSTNDAPVFEITGGVYQPGGGGPSGQTGARTLKMAARARTSAFARSINGSFTSATGATPPPASRIDIGQLGSGLHLNGQIRKLVIQADTSDEQLRLLTV